MIFLMGFVLLLCLDLNFNDMQFIQVQTKLKDVHKEASEKFITCLHRVALHHSNIVVQFDSKIFFILPKVNVIMSVYLFC